MIWTNNNNLLPHLIACLIIAANIQQEVYNCNMMKLIPFSTFLFWQVVVFFHHPKKSFNHQEFAIWCSKRCYCSFKFMLRRRAEREKWTDWCMSWSSGTCIEQRMRTENKGTRTLCPFSDGNMYHRVHPSLELASGAHFPCHLSSSLPSWVLGDASLILTALLS